jgi:hypothetical protein
MSRKNTQINQEIISDLEDQEEDILEITVPKNTRKHNKPKIAPPGFNQVIPKYVEWKNTEKKFIIIGCPNGHPNLSNTKWTAGLPRNTPIEVKFAKTLKALDILEKSNTKLSNEDIHIILKK